MVDGLFRRAKAFIGLEEELVDGGEFGQQLDMNSILKGKKENRKDVACEIVIYEPKVYEDSLNISTHLRCGSPVVINLKHLDPAEGTRLIDFVCGTAYAIDGHMVKIGESIFLFAPKSIALTSADDRSSLNDDISFETSEKRETFFSR